MSTPLPLPLRDRALQLSEFMGKLDSIRAGAGDLPEQYRFLLAHELRHLANELAAHGPRGAGTMSDMYGSRPVSVTPGTARLTLTGHAPSVIIGTAPENGRGEVVGPPRTGAVGASIAAATGRSEGTSTVTGRAEMVEGADTLAAFGTVSDPIPPPAGDASSTRMKLIEFFMARSNTPASVKEMICSTGATLGSITTILYKRSLGDFEKCGSAPSGAAPQKLWRLTQKSINEYYYSHGDDRPTPPETGP